MSGPADIERFPPPALGAPATPTTPGTVPQYPIPQAGVDGLVTDLAEKLSLDANGTLLLGGAAASPNSKLAILGTKTVAVPAANTVWRALDFQASTLTLTAGGVAPAELASVRFAAPVITQTAGVGYTIPEAATVIIDGPPEASAAGGATPTLSLRTFALRITKGALGVGGATGAGEVRAYMDANNYTALRGASNKNGLYQAGRNFFCYYDGNNGDTVLDSVYSGAKLCLNIGGTTKAVVTNVGNLCVGATAAGATAEKVLALSNSATAPTGSANLVHLYAADKAGDDACLCLYQEAALVAAVGAASTHKVPCIINGTAGSLLFVAD